MTELNFLDSHVELLLRDVWNLTAIKRDKDNDIPFRRGDAHCYVKVEAPVLLVRVIGIAAVEMKPDADLLREVNDINTRLRSAHAVLYGSDLVVEQTMHASGVTRASLAQACDHVGFVAADIGPMIADIFGGRAALASSAVDTPGAP